MIQKKVDPYRRGAQGEKLHSSDGEPDDGSDSAIELLIEMLVHLPADRRDLTIRFGRKILEIAPANTVAWWQLLNALAEEQRATELMCFAKIASETFRSEPSFAYFLGWAYYLQNQPALASSIFESVVAMDPWYDPALYWLGEIAFASGAFEKSEEWFIKCLAISPDKGGYLSRLALVILFRGKSDQACALAEQARLLESTCVGTLRNVAEVFLYAGDLDRAEGLLAPLPSDYVADLLTHCWREKQNRSQALHLGRPYQPLFLRLIA